MGRTAVKTANNNRRWWICFHESTGNRRVMSKEKGGDVSVLHPDRTLYVRWTNLCLRVISRIFSQQTFMKGQGPFSVSIKTNSNIQVQSYHVRYPYAVRTLEALRLPGRITNYFVKGSIKDDTKWTGHMLPPGETGKRSSRPSGSLFGNMGPQGAGLSWEMR